MKDIGLLLFRTYLGLGLMNHGLQKIIGYEQMKDSFPSPIGLGSHPSLLLAIAVEFVCPIFVIIGFRMKYAIIPILGLFITIFFIVLAGTAFSSRELSFLYFFGFLGLLLTGTGKYSIDKN